MECGEGFEVWDGEEEEVGEEKSGREGKTEMEELRGRGPNCTKPIF